MDYNGIFEQEMFELKKNNRDTDTKGNHGERKGIVQNRIDSVLCSLDFAFDHEMKIYILFKFRKNSLGRIKAIVFAFYYVGVLMLQYLYSYHHSF